MPIESTESLVQSLRASGLLTPLEWEALSEQVRIFNGDTNRLMRHLVDRGCLTAYQLRKVVNGHGSELVLGPYRILDKLGEGGMGRVFRARHVRHNRVVALKVVREHLLSKPTARGRYEREVQAALALSHPNIVSVSHAGSTDGRYFIEMEFVDGLDLARMVQMYGVFSVSEACEYARQAALGLHHAHEQGFVHRDIKPSNIMVCGSRHIPEAEEPATVKILDMGLVRMIGDEEGERGLTRDGTVVGTPDYMAPEQAKNSRLVDRRADLYSLGATVYFMLMGSPPFPDGTALDKIICHAEQAPPLLSSMRSDVPAGLARIVEKLMAKHTRQRFATAEEVAVALQPWTAIASEPGRSTETVSPSSVTSIPAPNGAPQKAETPASSQEIAGRAKISIGSALVFAGAAVLALGIFALVLKVALAVSSF